MQNKITKPTTKFKEFALSHQKTRKGKRLLEKLFPESEAEPSKQIQVLKRAKIAPGQGKTNNANKKTDNNSPSNRIKMSPVFAGGGRLVEAGTKASPVPNLNMVSVPLDPI